MTCCIVDQCFGAFSWNFDEVQQYKYAVMADIPNMFFHISLEPKDQNVLRFFPFTEGRPDFNDQWGFTVMLYGLVCEPSIAGFCIKYTINKNYANVPLEY